MIFFLHSLERDVIPPALDGTVSRVSSVAHTHTYTSHAARPPQRHTSPPYRQRCCRTPTRRRRCPSRILPQRSRSTSARLTHLLYANLLRAPGLSRHTPADPLFLPTALCIMCPSLAPVRQRHPHDACACARARVASTSLPHPSPHAAHVCPRRAPATGRARATGARGAHEPAAKRPGVGRAPHGGELRTQCAQRLAHGACIRRPPHSTVGGGCGNASSDRSGRSESAALRAAPPPNGLHRLLLLRGASRPTAAWLARTSSRSPKRPWRRSSGSLGKDGRRRRQHEHRRIPLARGSEAAADGAEGEDRVEEPRDLGRRQGGLVGVRPWSQRARRLAQLRGEGGEAHGGWRGATPATRPAARAAAERRAPPRASPPPRPATLREGAGGRRRGARANGAASGRQPRLRRLAHLRERTVAARLRALAGRRRRLPAVDDGLRLDAGLEGGQHRLLQPHRLLQVVVLLGALVRRLLHRELADGVDVLAAREGLREALLADEVRSETLEAAGVRRGGRRVRRRRGKGRTAAGVTEASEAGKAGARPLALWRRRPPPGHRGGR